MKERPILFSGAMVRALLAGIKTQTRRVVKAKHLPWLENSVLNFLDGKWNQRPLPYGQPGDRLWVRETFCKIIGQSGGWIETDYRATYNHGFRLGDSLGLKKRWTPSIHMPRDASRITLEVTGVRVERLQDISEADAIAEGVFRKVGASSVGDMVETATGGQLIYADPTQAREEYRRLWEEINGSGSWVKNPWVWVVDFRRIEAEGGAT